MTLNITQDDVCDLENLVIQLFDAIKCAAATDNQVRLYLNKYEVKRLAEQLGCVSNLEIS